MYSISWWQSFQPSFAQWQPGKATWWMHGCMHEKMDGWMHFYEFMNESTHRWMDGWMDEWMDGWWDWLIGQYSIDLVNGQMDGRMDGLTNERKNEWMNRWQLMAKMTEETSDLNRCSGNVVIIAVDMTTIIVITTSIAIIISTNIIITHIAIFPITFIITITNPTTTAIVVVIIIIIIILVVVVTICILPYQV